jgi:methylenetetrahydrofolate--tRNA-(uracil-5-)-methyltransferase
MPCPVKNKSLIIIGGGLAGTEAAWQAAQRNIKVQLYEMRPNKMTSAHRTPYLAELVCSNSFKAQGLDSASGLLKEELKQLGSLIMQVAEQTAIPAGNALAVDRQAFAQQVTKALEMHPNIEIYRKEVTALPLDQVVVIASGPLTSDPLAYYIAGLTGEQNLSFYDAISPIIDGETIDYSKTFFASRYDKGGKDYLNCPLSKEQYDRLVQELIQAEKVPLRDFEQRVYFEACLPIEEMALRGPEVLAYGPLKPVGLRNPQNLKTPYAVVQLRKEDLQGNSYNMVGFQTKLTYPEQKRVFRLIPGLERAEFLRLGSLHRNTFIKAPVLLYPTLQLRYQPHYFFAGQITGVEGYLESAATGLLAGINAARLIQGREVTVPYNITALGALVHYLAQANPESFQPMNINYGLFPPLGYKIKNKNEKKRLLAIRALKAIKEWLAMLSQT